MTGAGHLGRLALWFTGVNLATVALALTLTRLEATGEMVRRVAVLCGIGG